MIFVIVGPVNQENRAGCDTGYVIYRPNGIVIDPIDGPDRDKSSRGKQGRKVTTLRNFSLKSGKDIGKGTVGNDGLNSRFFRGCHD
jgi:hypothetical protein